MNWITNFVRPRINSMLGRREMPENLWIKDPESGEMVFHKDLEENQYVIPSSGHHMRIVARERLKRFLDNGEYETLENPKVATDPLKFRDERRYTDRLRDAKTKTGLDDAVLSATGEIEGLPIVATVQDFGFMGGSLGMAAGEAIIKGFETALRSYLTACIPAATCPFQGTADDALPIVLVHALGLITGTVTLTIALKLRGPAQPAGRRPRWA
jgi:acetyl-CoA carboxylase carboxyl transferase subunit beta